MSYTMYLIPGVGCDERVFHFLHLPPLDVVHLQWEKPLYNENLDEYVVRLIPQIKKDTMPIFIGLSFGGIVAIELAKRLPYHKVILISSLKTYFERPLRMNLMEILPLHRFLPARLAVNFDFWHNWAFGQTDEKEKAFIQDMIKNVDLEFNEWAVHQAITWGNTEELNGLVHIHGDNDNIFPVQYIRNYINIPGGTHLMIINKAQRISEIINEELKDLVKPKKQPSKSFFSKK